jgi:hypothetical protein
MFHLKRQSVESLKFNHGSAIGTRHHSLDKMMLDQEHSKATLTQIIGKDMEVRKIMRHRKVEP